MSIYLELPLFGKPGWMLNEGQPVTADALTDLAEYLSVHLLDTAAILEKLSKHGWKNECSMYSIVLIPKSPFKTAVEAVQELIRLGIDPQDVDIDDEDGVEAETDCDCLGVA